MFFQCKRAKKEPKNVGNFGQEIMDTIESEKKCLEQWNDSDSGEARIKDDRSAKQTF